MKMHILTDNRTNKRGFLAEHGLSIYIEHEKANILFDTGQSDVYCRNAAQMDMDFNKTDCIVLSHGHYDHCGGLIHFPKTDRFPKVYVHEFVFAKRYAQNADGKSCREVGIPWSFDDYSFIKNNIVFTRKNLQIAPGVNLCGEIPSTLAFEGVPEGFYTGDDVDKSVDMMKDEQMLIFDTGKGLCIFLGCSHPGVVNCLNYAIKQFPGKKIDTLVAGMHLNSVSPLRLQMTMQAMLDLNIQRIIPLHCTGIFAICEMKRFLGDRCLPLCAGDSLEL
ncbi:Metallo-beta-lactamase superfamily protein [Pelotomaculum sp. FP]|uniref:MBL fold metallo-hydrolase n=1 Tax=Pelotomaculum sp. FP TaxID=261474 RepID=UPI001064C2EE|nr:MBL fold metallo-hydrolase [Pelotomaculum sp. FP]TEB17810.1 Metallo-beta-lactamase superfamily protein [Pelotomaculum sp. FP]